MIFFFTEHKKYSAFDDDIKWFDIVIENRDFYTDWPDFYNLFSYIGLAISSFLDLLKDSQTPHCRTNIFVRTTVEQHSK